MLSMLGSGMLTSLLIFCVTLLFSLPLGMLICLGRRSGSPVLRWILRVYISVMRGTPLMLQLVVVYFAPYSLFGVSLGSLFGGNYRIMAVLIGFVINYAAYFAEIYRAGLESIPAGQYEAAKVLGYSRPQTFMCIILPQLTRRVLPTVTNEVITLIKDTSLAYTVSVVEMFTVAKQISAAETDMTALFVAGLIYYVFNFAVAFGMERLERRMNTYSIR
ncbi:MAG: amino acid ABC transporter permease [Eubacteriales bacterium]|nr:amino acid ABC transporter permease [Eubacteriales bacterium]